jgi:alkanesulfonate monooxygenase SsuD/methylene tetrahydromethanopterin reductase-like flavin-dependent oxidoreductase (luciferase family)
MKFGIFYELIALRPHDEAAVVRAYKEALEQIKLAEEMGFEYVWETEHHFLEKFSYSAAPELFLTAVAQHTSRIRVGHGAVLLTMNNPVRVAERAAVLDILSDGRLEFGTARGVSEAELGGFMIEPEDSRPMWEEAVRMIPRMWMQDSFEANGKYFRMPARNIIPKPIQKPHPPMWVACTTPPTFELAGRMGLGVLSFSLSAPGQSEKAIDVYRQAIRNAEPVGAFANNQIAAFTTTVCLGDDAEARRVGSFSAAAYAEGARQLYSQWSKSEDGWRAWYGREYFTEHEITPEAMDKLCQDGVVCVGDPESCIRTIKRWEELGVDQIMCLVQAGRIPHALAMETIRNFGKYIIPYFKQRASSAQASSRDSGKSGDSPAG